MHLGVTLLASGDANNALAELDPDFGDRHILLVDRRDGKALASNEGPFRMIAPEDKRHARWVRNVTSLTVKSAE